MMAFAAAAAPFCCNDSKPDKHQQVSYCEVAGVNGLRDFVYGSVVQRYHLHIDEKQHLG